MTQFRKNNKRNPLSKVISYFYRRYIGQCGENVNFDSVVYLMRNPKKISIKSGAYIKSGARLCPCNEGAEILIGQNTTVGYNTNIFSSKKITIGDDCMIAANVYIVDSDHGTARNQLMNNQENITDEIIIENDVWLGAGAVILKGSYISKGCVIAANSVVKGRLEPYGIYGGIPVKKISERI